MTLIHLSPVRHGGGGRAHRQDGERAVKRSEDKEGDGGTRERSNLCAKGGVHGPPDGPRVRTSLSAYQTAAKTVVTNPMSGHRDVPRSRTVQMVQLRVP